MTDRSSRLGFLAVASAAVLWAGSGTYGRSLIDRGASPLEITEARAWIAFLGLGALSYIRGRRTTAQRDGSPGPAEAMLFRLARRAWRATLPRTRASTALIVVFGLSIAGANYFYYSAIATLPVAVAVVIQYTAPGLVVGWLAAAEGLRPSGRVLGALAVAFAGVGLLSELPKVLSSGETVLAPRGVLAAAASAVAFACYIVAGERLGRVYTPEGALARGFGVASALWVVVQIAHGRPDTLLDGSLLPGVILLGFIATIIPFLLFVWGMRRIGASRAGIVSSLEPLSAALFAYAFLDQRLDGVQIAGAALVIAGIVIVQSEQEASVPTPSPIE